MLPSILATNAKSTPYQPNKCLGISLKLRKYFLNWPSPRCLQAHRDPGECGEVHRQVHRGRPQVHQVRRRHHRPAAPLQAHMRRMLRVEPFVDYPPLDR